MQKKINIISFDIPFPANYGGVIDVFYKLKALKESGVKIILHCFEYGRPQQKELEKYCVQVFYYKRSKNFFQLFSELPFIVKSRINKELKKNLLSNDCPILFEGLHTCYLLNDNEFKNRIKIFRESNIEHDYYTHLAAAEKNLLKKKFLISEAKKLKRFEKIVSHSNFMLIVSESEVEYFKKKYPKNNIEYLPSFHGNNSVTSRIGTGKYILYHGNLSVIENESAAEYLIENVFSKITQSIVIAGMNPSVYLINLCRKHKNIQLIKNPSQKKMHELIENAQLHCMYTAQPTGLKLKLLNVLYKGRFVLANKNMLTGTSLKDVCTVVETPLHWIKEINLANKENFSQKNIQQRKLGLIKFNDAYKTKKIINLLWP